MPGIEVRGIDILPSTLLALIDVKLCLRVLLGCVFVLQIGMQQLVDGLFNHDSFIRLASIR